MPATARVCKSYATSEHFGGNPWHGGALLSPAWPCLTQSACCSACLTLVSLLSLARPARPWSKQPVCGFCCDLSLRVPRTQACCKGSIRRTSSKDEYRNQRDPKHSTLDIPKASVTKVMQECCDVHRCDVACVHCVVPRIKALLYWTTEILKPTIAHAKQTSKQTISSTQQTRCSIA